MENNKLLDVIKNVEHKSNKELFESLNILSKEFESTKELIINLTRHMDSIEEMYDIVNKEIGKRVTK